LGLGLGLGSGLGLGLGSGLGSCVTLAAMFLTRMRVLERRGGCDEAAPALEEEAEEAEAACSSAASDTPCDESHCLVRVRVRLRG
jgi:hypothetical protein